MGKTLDIITKVRTELVDHIKYEMELLHHGYKHDADENINTDSGEWKRTPIIKVAVDNSYLDVEDVVYEKRDVTALYLNDDGSVSVTDSEETEHRLTDFGTDDLVDIALALEDAYNNIIKK